MDVPRVKLIVGLGNPGPEYAQTRHNVGFMVAERLGRRLKGADAERHVCDSLLVCGRLGGRALAVARPLTYMNRSGDAVGKLQRRLDLRADEIFIIYDCLDLPLGRLRVRGTGGSGGHNGMTSVIEALGTEDVPRLRVGIGRTEDADAVAYVLSPWELREHAAVDAVLTAAADATVFAVRRGIAAAMNAYNGWSLSDDVRDVSTEPSQGE
jgi:PTH1 family peptidyl-tRNA hydrolase